VLFFVVIADKKVCCVLLRQERVNKYFEVLDVIFMSFHKSILILFNYVTVHFITFI